MFEEKDIKENVSQFIEEMNEIVDSFDSFHDFLDEKDALFSDIKRNTGKYVVKTLQDNGLFYKNDDIKDYRLSFNTEHNDSDLVRTVYKFLAYMSTRRSLNDCISIDQTLSDSMDDAYPLLKGGLSWTFLSKERKEEAVKAVNYIDRIYKSNYIKKIESAVQSYRDLDMNGAEAHFRFYAKDYTDMINRIVGTKFYSENDPEKPDFELLQKYREAYSRTNRYLNDVLSDTGKITDDVRKRAFSLVNKEAIKMLDDVSVDELNRNRKGFRVSALKNAGIETIGDVCRSSEYRIGDIYGISQLNAHEIKRAADQIYSDTRGAVKLRISADDKNTDTTMLLSALYAYIQNKEYINEAEGLKRRVGEELDTTINSISSLDDDYKWYRSDLNKKGFYSRSFDLFEEVSQSGYVNSVVELYKNKKELVSGSLNDGEVWDFFIQNSARCISELDELIPGLFGSTDTFYGLPDELAEKIQEECIFPDGLKVTLRRYQEWGVKYILHQKKVLLGDEMGLGKTIQAIAAMVSLRNVGEDHFMVVCPASVVINWCREIEKHSKLTAIKIHGASKKQMLDRWMKKGGVGVTTYETTAMLDLPDDFKYSMLVVDEAHYVKNPDANRTKNVIELGKKTDRILYMTGTPLENKVDEMAELIRQLQPEVADNIRSISHISMSDIFRERVAPVYYRRKREEVLTELPELIENEEWCSLDSEEKEIYEKAVLSKSFGQMRRVSWNVKDLSISSKAARLKEIVEEVKEEGRKLIVFSFYRDTISKLYEYFHETCLFPITGSVNVKKRQEIIDEFDKAPAGTMLISQIQAGGTGLNIQSASVVIIAEPQIKPSIENQAISRAYRMGQSRNVLVYRLLCENTIDERIFDLLKEKQRIFDAFADRSEAAKETLELDNKSIGNIIEEEIERIGKEYGMDPEELRKKMGIKNDYSALMDMGYEDLVQHLLDKYGPAEGDYFLTESCKSPNPKIKRTGEGLFIHHIDEDKHIMLSDEAHAVNLSFEYQKADRLVYCNFLEHFLLHIKIAEEASLNDFGIINGELPGIGGAVNIICRQINWFYGGKATEKDHLSNAYSIISNDFDSYIVMLKKLWKVIVDNPLYSIKYTKEDLAMDMNGEKIDKIFQAI